MPELPEVQTVLDGLWQVIQGRKIRSVECFYPGTLILDQSLERDVFPAKVVQASRRGKYMILELDSQAGMIIHLRMTGKLVFESHPGEPHKHERARINLEGGDAFRFIDPRTFGKISIFALEDIASFLPKLGVEPLEPEYSAEYLQTAFAKRSAPVKNLLLDQSLVAGLGNIYVCELLFRAGIRPTREGNKLKKAELTRVVKHSKDVLAEALAVGGTSISDYRRIDDKTGEFQNFLRVYQKCECPLGHPIANVRLGGRSSFYCPVCQK